MRTSQLATIWEYRYFWLSLVQMDLKTRYRRSLLGVGWSLLNPIMMTIIFCVIFSQWFKQDWRASAPYYLGGLAVWDFIRQCAIQGAYTFIRTEPYIRQSPLPLAVYTIRTTLSFGIHFFIATGLFIVTAFIFYPGNRLDLVKVIPVVFLGLLMMMVFGWAICAFFAYLTVNFRDVIQLIEVIFTMAFFLTPIIYPYEVLINKGKLWLADINPAVAFFRMIRDPLLYGQYPEAYQFGLAVLFTVFFFSVAMWMTIRNEKRVIFQL